MLSRVLTLFTHGCEGHAARDPSGTFVKQSRSDTNGAEADSLPHETLKVESLKSVLNKSAKPERFPGRISFEQLHRGGVAGIFTPESAKQRSRLPG